MSVIVTDNGFAETDWAADLSDDQVIDIASETDPAEITVADLPQLVKIAFPSFADGRGFGIAKRLRNAGYTGTLRAVGHVISDQYAMARRSGFDEVEISDDLAARQPQDEWNFRANWQAHDYQSRLRAS